MLFSTTTTEWPLLSTTTLVTVTTTLLVTTTTVVPPTTSTSTSTTTTLPAGYDCVVDADCYDGSFCTSDSTCNSGVCRYPSDGYTCCDFIACTAGDMCLGGVCLPGLDDCAAGALCSPETGECERADSDLWIPAAVHPSAVFSGAMTTSAEFAGGTDADPVLDSIVPELVFADSPAHAFSGGSGDSVAYTIDIPAAGEWFLWGRFY